MPNEKEYPQGVNQADKSDFAKLIQNLDRLRFGPDSVNDVVSHVIENTKESDGAKAHLIPNLDTKDMSERSNFSGRPGHHPTQSHIETVKAHLEAIRHGVGPCREYYYQLGKGSAPGINKEPQRSLYDALEKQGYLSLLDSIDAVTARALHALDSNTGLYQALFDKLGSRNESPKR